MSSDVSEHTLRRRFPHPIAAAWHRASHLAENPDQRLTQLIACNQILLRTLAVMLLPDYLRGPADPAAESMLERFLRQPVADGVWLGLVRELIRAIGHRTEPTPFIPEIYPWFFTKSGKPTRSADLLTELINLRNKAVHPPPGDNTPVRTRALQIRQNLLSVLLDMGWLTGYRPFRVASIETTRSGTFRGKVQFLVGREEHNEFVHGEWAAHLVKQAVYLTNPSGTDLLDLVPFAEFSQDRLYLLNKIHELREVVLVHDTTGSPIQKSVETEAGEMDFGLWLQKRDKYTPHVSVGTNSSIFRVGATEMAAETDIDLGPRFEKREELGRGGMAIVFRVFDRDKGKECALKVLKSEYARDDTASKRFRREALNMSRARHERIVNMLEIANLPNGQPFLMMPVMANGNLQDHIVTGGARPETVVRRWGEEALEALECIHRMDMVHRDIKPSNFLVDDDDHVLLADFGIALGPNDEHWTETIGRLVTAAYMAPEQAVSRDVTAKADIYSLSIVLHELLTGSRPKGPPGKGIRGRFGELIRRMGAPEPESRPSATRALMELKRLPPVRHTTSSTRLPATRPPRITVTDRIGEEPPAGPVMDDESAITERQEIPIATQAAETGEATARTIEEETEPLHVEPRHTAVQSGKAIHRSRWIAAAIFVLLFGVNWLETSIETSLRTNADLTQERQLAEAAMWFERDISFEHHDTLSKPVSLGFSIVYFGIFPLLMVATAAGLAVRRDPQPLLLFAVAAAVDYAITLPFYLLFPVPERWSYPDANAILLSDIVNTHLIELFRPFSGLNNCFPSFHVSLTVVALICLYRAKAPFRTTAVPLGAAIILSTFALGIHWLSDIVAGLAIGVVSVWVASRLQHQIAPGASLIQQGAVPVTQER